MGDAHAACTPYRTGQIPPRRWGRAWNDDTVDGLCSRFGGGGPPKLSYEHFEELCTIFEDGQPWTPQAIGTFIKDRYGVTYHPEHLSRKLREAGMNYVKPRPMDPRRPDDADEILAERLKQALGEDHDEEADPIVFGFFR
ncbi:winged helix-turn-helix domain-containing protein [Haloarcula sp. H-GB4]|nr:winged helix-turn-helix domain-containing protein [Haloarcula sp. H-GB4]MDQ2072356.1 winged helix-turn-helix domain-containing protein [Haloarcula sp. H-GB4]